MCLNSVTCSWFHNILVLCLNRTLVLWSGKIFLKTVLLCIKVRDHLRPACCVNWNVLFNMYYLALVLSSPHPTPAVLTDLVAALFQVTMATTVHTLLTSSCLVQHTQRRPPLTLTQRGGPSRPEGLSRPPCTRVMIGRSSERYQRWDSNEKPRTSLLCSLI